MPQITIQVRERHKSFVLADADEFKEGLTACAAGLFAVDEWPLSLHDFGVTFDFVAWPSTLTNDLVVRIPLHDFPERVAQADHHTDEIIAFVGTFWASRGVPNWTVGVSLTYVTTSWQSAQIATYPRQQSPVSLSMLPGPGDGNMVISDANGAGIRVVRVTEP